MLNLTQLDAPYIEALVASRRVARVLLQRQLDSGEYLGTPVWHDLSAVEGAICVLWTTDRLRRHSVR